MKENTYKPQIPDMMEAIFDAAYLTFDLVAAILFFIYAKGNTLFVLYGILTLTLCGGDAFHLVPKIIKAVSDEHHYFEIRFQSSLWNAHRFLHERIPYEVGIEYAVAGR